MFHSESSKHIAAAEVRHLPQHNRHRSRPTDTSDHDDLLAAIRLILEETIGPRLEAIAHSIRTMPAANDDIASDANLVYRLPAVLSLLGISKSTWYAWSNPNSASYDPSLPRAIKLGDHARSPSVWRADDITAWLESRARASHSRAV